MAEFTYQASDRNGQIRKGTLTAESLEDALEKISQVGLIPIDIKKGGSGPSGFIYHLKTRYLRVPPVDLIVFTKQLATMIRVGIPMPQAFSILKDQTEQPRLRLIAEIIQQDIEGGMSLSKAVGKHPKVFSIMFCSMIEAGETSGTLPEVLDRLLYLIEHEAKVKSEIKTAMRYPLLVIGTLAIAFLVMIGFVIPRFVEFFSAQKLVLPLPTRICITLSEILSNYGLFCLLGAIIIGFCSYHFFYQTQKGKMFRDRAFLALPLIGPILGLAQ